MKKCYSQKHNKFNFSIPQVLTIIVSFLAVLFILPLHALPAIAENHFQENNTQNPDSIPELLSEAALTKIAGDICLCLTKVNDSRSATEIEQDMEACFSVNLVNHFPTLEAEFGDELFNGTDVNQALMEQVGLQVGDRLYNSCPRFTQLFKP